MWMPGGSRWKKCAARLDGLIVIGGNGSQTGSWELTRLGFPVVGVASTVDNDLYGSDISIGVDTALDIIIESIDRIRTTVESHHRAFLIEVMGKTCGCLAPGSRASPGADVIVTPEFDIAPRRGGAAAGGGACPGQALRPGRGHRWR